MNTQKIVRKSMVWHKHGRRWRVGENAALNRAAAMAKRPAAEMFGSVRDLMASRRRSRP